MGGGERERCGNGDGALGGVAVGVGDADGVGDGARGAGNVEAGRRIDAGAAEVGGEREEVAGARATYGGQERGGSGREREGARGDSEAFADGDGGRCGVAEGVGRSDDVGDVAARACGVGAGASVEGGARQVLGKGPDEANATAAEGEEGDACLGFDGDEVGRDVEEGADVDGGRGLVAEGVGDADDVDTGVGVARFVGAGEQIEGGAARVDGEGKGVSCTGASGGEERERSAWRERARGGTEGERRADGNGGRGGVAEGVRGGDDVGDVSVGACGVDARGGVEGGAGGVGGKRIREAEG